MDSIALLDQEYILSNSFPVFPKCGIYFLIRNNQIVYIGKSTTLAFRLQEHRRGKDFNRVFFIECEEDELLELEKRYIKKFAPPLNKKQNPTYIEPPKPRGLRRFRKEIVSLMMEYGFGEQQTRRRFFTPEILEHCRNLLCRECGRLGMDYRPFANNPGRHQERPDRSYAVCLDCGWSMELPQFSDNRPPIVWIPKSERLISRENGSEGSQMPKV